MHNLVDAQKLVDIIIVIGVPGCKEIDNTSNSNFVIRANCIQWNLIYYQSNILVNTVRETNLFSGTLQSIRRQIIVTFWMQFGLHKATMAGIVQPINWAMLQVLMSWQNLFLSWWAAEKSEKYQNLKGL